MRGKNTKKLSENGKMCCKQVIKLFSIFNNEFKINWAAFCNFHQISTTLLYKFVKVSKKRTTFNLNLHLWKYFEFMYFNFLIFDVKTTKFIIFENRKNNNKKEIISLISQMYTKNQFLFNIRLWLNVILGRNLF